MALNSQIRKKIIFLRLRRHLSYRVISSTLQCNDDIKVSPETVRNWTSKHNKHGNHYIADNSRPLKARGIKVHARHMEFIDRKIRENSEVSSVDLQKMLRDEHNLSLSASYIRKLRVKLGWVSKRTRYGQMVRDVNKEKRVQWAQEQMDNNETFHNVIFSDEASIEIERTALKTFYKKGERILPRPKPKHPLKVCLFV
jgi:transposase